MDRNKRILIVCAVLGVIMAGCNYQSAKAEEKTSNMQCIGYMGHNVYEFVHTETGVHYALFTYKTAGGITVMLNPDGMPYTGE